MRFDFCKVALLAALMFLTGCTTEAAKRAMDRPIPADQFTGFGAGNSDKSKRTAEKPKEIKDDMEPEQAVSTLVEQLQNSKASFSITAEEQLLYWGSKPGVDKIVARRVRPLLKSARVELRAPAVRLTVVYGGRDSIGDLIECLGDSEVAIREQAARALQAAAPKDFGYDPNAGELARANSVNEYRRWWQYESRRGSVQPATIYENNPPVQASVKPTQPRQSVSSSGEIVR